MAKEEKTGIKIQLRVYNLFIFFLLNCGASQSFYIEDEMELKKDQLVTILGFPKEIEISFEIKPTSYVEIIDNSNIIHITVGSNDRLFGAWVHYDKIFFGFTVGDAVIYSQLSYLPLMEWTKVKVTQTLVNGVYIYNLFCAGVNLFSGQNTVPRELRNLKVYLSSPWFDLQPGFIRNLYINAIEDIFTISEEKSLIQNQLVAVLNKLPKEYQLSFEFKLTQYKNTEYSSIIHLTVGEDATRYGDRTPDVYITPYGYFEVSSAINGNLNSYKAFDQQIFPLEEWTTVKITQIIFDGKYIFTIEVSGTYYSVENLGATEFGDVKVYMGDPWLTIQPGYIRNLVIANAIAASTSTNTLPNWSSGFYADLITVKSFISNQDCVQFCWQEILNGKLYVGVATDISSCYCTKKVMLGTVTQNLNNKNLHLEFLLSNIITKSSIYSISELATFCIRIRFFIEGNDRSIFYFFDDLSEPTKYSGRMIINSFVDFGRSVYATRTTKSHNESHLLNYVEETYNGTGKNTEYENLYDIVAKVGDMSVENEHLTWAMLLVANSNSMWITFTPFKILRLEKNCRLITQLSSNITNERMYVNVNMTTSPDCVTDLENITLELLHESKLIFKGILMDDLSVTATSIQKERKFIIHVRKLFIDSHLKFLSIYDIDRSEIRLGKTNVALATQYFLSEFIHDKSIFNVKKNVLFLPVESSIQPNVNKVIPKWNYRQQNGTYLQTATHKYVCSPTRNRQQTSCYQQEISTGRVQFLPVQLCDLIGFDQNTNFIYGYSFRKNIVEVNLNRKNQIEVVIISNVKWSRILESGSLLVKK